MFSQVIRISFFNVKGLFIYLYTGCGCLAASFSGGTAVLLMSCPCYSTLGLLLPTLEGSIHPLGTYSVQSVGAAEAFPWLLDTILDGSPLRHRIPAFWHSFCRPWKDDRLNLPYLVLIQQPNRIISPATYPWSQHQADVKGCWDGFTKKYARRVEIVTINYHVSPSWNPSLPH